MSKTKSVSQQSPKFAQNKPQGPSEDMFYTFFSGGLAFVSFLDTSHFVSRRDTPLLPLYASKCRVQDKAEMENLKSNTLFEGL